MSDNWTQLAEEYEISDAELASLDSDEGGDDDVPGALPVLAVVGRPNVGKSTLVNRVLGRREAVVQDVPGVTRDRVAYDALWNGRRFTLVDTGGWEPDAQGRAAAIADQARYAMTVADAVLLVVDARVGITETDAAVARVLQRGGKPVVLAANKVDDTKGEADVAELWRLGLGEPWPVSALHGRGSGDLLDKVLEVLPEAPQEGRFGTGGPRRVALVGRPNVGKSSLLNAVTKENRAVVDAVAGTTVDPVDSLVELGDEVWRFVDTAGLRKKVTFASGAEYYASLRTAAAIEAAEVAVVLLDASEPLSEQDQRVITTVVETGRALVLAFNKWDLLDEDRRELLEREIDRDLQRIRWAPRVNISARTRRAVDKLAPALRTSLEGWEQRIPTGRLNSWLSELVAAHPHPVRGGKQTRILFATQAGSKPPRFVLFTSGPVDVAYTRYIERRLREDYGFAGTPIQITVRIKEKRKRR
ncbi:ribosome biogenesis GTPase Der [Cryptosporangium arvum]|uniref:GTPase Der n=1 Tax=Cryptosporangium arvum DSM 44712 TaxID=927661 RepID=A0A010ZW34_9ACTN|nr:ribosome biogenesis GTPase Der [Cryptosporangium arvum]EXG81427.1 ribosome-associated GTPase EngA [Cryptosporangium arvum DSM 44712]